MASPLEINQETNFPQIQQATVDEDLENNVAVDYSGRAQWIRAAVLGASDGLISVASMLMAVGAVRTDAKAMILTGLAGLIAGACSMAAGEFVSVYSQSDIEIAQLRRQKHVERNEFEAKRKDLAGRPFKAAAASAVAFALGASVPLLAGAFVKKYYYLRLGVVMVASSLALLGFGGVGAFLGRAPLVISSLRVLIGGWAAMGITFGLTKLVGQAGVFD